MSESRSGGVLTATLASLTSLVAALSCCLPPGTLLMAAGLAGAAIFSERLRSLLLVFSVLSLVFAFVQTYVRRRLRTALLWFSAVMVPGMMAAPRLMSSLPIGRLPSLRAAGDWERLVALLSPT